VCFDPASVAPPGLFPVVASVSVEKSLVFFFVMFFICQRFCVVVSCGWFVLNQFAPSGRRSTFVPVHFFLSLLFFFFLLVCGFFLLLKKILHEMSHDVWRCFERLMEKYFFLRVVVM